MATKVCVQINQFKHPIVLRQTDDRFNLQYGKQNIEGLTFEQAVTNLGAVLMHAAQVGNADRVHV